MRHRALVFALLLLTASAASAQVSFVTIDGNPLKIHVGADASFQIFNTSVPGSGQIYPSNCSNTADMGVFANVNGALVAPNFTRHGCSTATGNLGNYTPWGGTVSAVTGDGTSATPFTVTVSASGGGVVLTMVVTYVNGQNYFRIHNTFASPTSTHVNAFLGADIFLASSDFGMFFFEQNLRAPGGHDCGVPATYNILLIPITPANRFSAAFYGDIWGQIGQGILNNDATPTTCIDNGAALEWDDILHGGTVADISSAVSFGDIPPASAFQPFFVTVTPPQTEGFAGDTLQFDVKTVHSADAGFNNDLFLSIPNLPDGMTAAFDPSKIPAPGDGSSKLTIHLSDDVFPLTYNGITVLASSGDLSEGASVAINAICDPPLILSLPSSQPKSQSVSRGSSVTLSVKTEQSGGAHYQWYNGYTGFTWSPIANSDSPTFTTPAIQGMSSYWVRVRNNCGTADSETAIITVNP